MTLRYHFTPGEVHRYAYRIGLAEDGPGGQSGEGSVTLILRYQVLNVASDGSATVLEAFDRLATTLNGKPQLSDDSTGPGVVLLLAPSGKVVEVHRRVAARTPSKVNPDDFSPMVYPDRALRLGEAFDGSDRFDVPGYDHPVTVIPRDELVGFAIAGQDRPTVELHETFALPDGQLKMSRDGVTVSGKFSGEIYHYLDRETGWPLSGSGSALITITGSSDQTGRSVSIPLRMTFEYHEQAGVEV